LAPLPGGRSKERQFIRSADTCANVEVVFPFKAAPLSKGITIGHSAKKAASAPGINASLRLHSDESHTMLPERYLQGAPLKAPDVKQ